MRRRMPISIAVACGLALLLWGAVSLQRIFAGERDDARAALDTETRALSRYALVEL